MAPIVEKVNKKLGKEERDRKRVKLEEAVDSSGVMPPKDGIVRITAFAYASPCSTASFGRVRSFKK